MATIYVDSRPYVVEDGHNLLAACLSQKLQLPYFCWHPAMHSIGACRQCAVKQFKDDRDTRGRIVMACMTPALDGTRISIQDPEAREFRAAVIEFLMTNHPHDCPVCDEGGECHLQDMTVMTGHTRRRYRFKKRTHRNQYLGPFINHEMNRCIACYRCVRFYRDYAGGRDLDVFFWHNDVFFGRYEDGVLENEFAGNLVEVCPTGVFTDKTQAAHYTRKWDLQTAPSVCVHCAVGCNTIPGERAGLLRRIRNRYHREVNGYFLCDRGRYGYEFVNSPMRVRQPLAAAQPGSVAEPVGVEEALRRAMALVKDPRRVIGIGSPRASLESNFALRTLVGKERFFCGMADHECRLVAEALRLLREGPARCPSICDVRQSDAVFVLGEDLTSTAPVLALNVRQSTFQHEINLAKRLQIAYWDDAAVRQAIQQKRGPLFLATPVATRLDDAATHVYRAAPDDLVRFASGIARALEAQVGRVPDFPDELRPLVDMIAETLYAAEKPLVVAGIQLASEAMLHAAANIAWALCRHGRPAQLRFVFPECNTVGMGMLGGGDLSAACRAVREGVADTVVILENDLWRRAEESAAEELFQTARHVIVIDQLIHRTTSRAELVFPAATFAEGDGTLVSDEGRGQRYYQVFVPKAPIQESWRWIRDVMLANGRHETERWENFDGIRAALAAAVPELAAVKEISPPADFRIAGQRIPRQTHRASGRTALDADLSVHEPQPPADPDSPFAFSMEGYEGKIPGPLLPRIWSPGWNSPQAITRFQQEVNGPYEGGDPGRRLIEPNPNAQIAYFGDVPGPFQPRDREWLVVPLFHIFGSEEQSALAPGVAELTPKPYLAMNPDDAARLGIADGDEVEFTAQGARRWTLVAFLPTLAAGTVGLPSGLPDTPMVPPQSWIEIHPLRADVPVLQEEGRRE